MQNSSQWPCSMHPIPQLRLVGVRTSYIYFFLIFPGHQVLDRITNPYLAPIPRLYPVTTWHLHCHYLTTLKSLQTQRGAQPLPSVVGWHTNSFVNHRRHALDLFHKHLRSAYYLPSTVLNSLPIAAHLILITTLSRRYYSHPHFKNEETETKG